MAGIFGIAVLAGVIAGPATAAMTAWAESEGGRVRLVALPADADGKISAALQIEPAPGWITYWREPGDSGIPPQISITPDSNVTLAGIAYPVPKHIEAGSLRDFGYDGPVAFPLDLTLASADAEPRFDAQVFIGLCKNICIPFQADFSLTLPKAAQSAAQEAMIIETARASLPEAPGADFAVTGSDLAADHTTLHLSLTLPAGGDLPEIIVSGPACAYSPFAAKQADECARLMEYFSRKGIAYSQQATPVTSVSIGGEPIADHSPEALDKALAAAGYDLARVTPGAGNIALILIAILAITALSGITYGPVAALLSEMFPPAIRYSSLSIPYHLGTGYFGGFLPFISQYIVARTGDPFAGLWYTWGITLISLIITVLWLKEDRHGHVVA